MFDLLQYVKATPSTKTIPFVSVKVLEGILSQSSYENVKKAISLLGAAAFIDLAQWRIDLGKDEAAAQLRKTLHQLIANSLTV
jgi:hypothetical protein